MYSQNVMNILLEHIHIFSYIASDVFLLLFIMAIIVNINHSTKALKNKRKAHNYANTNYSNKFLIISYLFNILRHSTDSEFDSGNVFSIILLSVLSMIMYIIFRFSSKKEKEKKELIVEDFFRNYSSFIQK